MRCNDRPLKPCSHPPTLTPPLTHPPTPPYHPLSSPSHPLSPYFPSSDALRRSAPQAVFSEQDVRVVLEAAAGVGVLLKATAGQYTLAAGHGQR